MTQSLPARPSLTRLKKQAKQLLKQYRNKNQSALDEVNSHHPMPDSFNSLRDAQLTIAREYGFDGWQPLKMAVEDAVLLSLSNDEMVNQFIELACVLYTHGDSDKRYQSANRLLLKHPELSNANFITAIISNNLTEVKKQLQNNPKLANKPFGEHSWTPLMYLSYSRIDEPGSHKSALEIASLLIENGADVNAHTTHNEKYHFSVLTGAIGEGEGGVVNQPPHQYAKELASILLDAGANPNDSQALYNTIFTNSVDYWLPVLVGYGLNKKSPVNWEQSDNRPMTLDYLIANAVSTDKPNRVEYLLSLGANANTVCTYSQRSLLTIAIVNQHKQIESLLRNAGAEPVQLTQEQQFTLAVVTGNESEIDSLVKNNPELLNNCVLIQGASVAVLKQLIKQGLNVNQQLDNGRTLMHLLAIHGQLDELKYLIEQGANMALRDNEFHGTVVAFAHFNNQMIVRDYLLEQSENALELSACGSYQRLRQVLDTKPGLAKQISDVSGNTPLHLVCNWLSANAQYETRKKLMDLLIEKGADVHAKNNQGQTPIDLYKKENDDDNIELITKIILATEHKQDM